MGNNTEKKEEEEEFQNDIAFLQTPFAKNFFGKENISQKISDEIELHQNNNFLGKYADEFYNIKLIKKDFIYNLYKAKNFKENRNVGLKVYDKKKIEKGDYDYFIEQIKREEEIIKLCKSENIVNIYRKLETNEFIIFETESWDITLEDFIKEIRNSKLDKLITFKITILGVVKALKLINEKGIMHRDIKPSNIFIILDDKYIFKEPLLVKLGGFDYAIYIKDNTSESVGTIFYAAPEIIKNLEYDEKCDLWSFGIILHELLFGILPYGKSVTINIIKQSIYYEDNFYYHKYEVPIIDTIFQKLLTLNRKNRVNHKDIFDYIYQNENIFEELIKKIKPEKIFSHQPFISDIFENFQVKKSNCFLNKNEFMKKVKNIIEDELLPDIMEFPNGLIDPQIDILTLFIMMKILNL